MFYEIKMVKAIFWDNDGVLVDTERLYYKANKEIFSAIGIELTKEIYIENFLIKSKGAWHLAGEKGLGEEKIKKLRFERNSLYSKLLLKEARIIDGVEETLKKLHGKFLMGIVTSSRKDHFDIIHSKTNLLEYFDFILTSGDFKEPKPDPEPYLMAIKKSGLRKEECVVVEDSERGLTAALRAGLKCYVIPTSLTRNSSFSGATQILSSVTELIDELL